MNSNASFGVKDWKYKTLTISNLQIKVQSDFYTNNVQNDFHAFSGLSRKCKPVFHSPTKLHPHPLFIYLRTLTKDIIPAEIGRNPTPQGTKG